MSRNEQKLRTRARILDAAGRGFRKGGFGGIGVDGLAKEAGVTSGAFYVHFDSKTQAFREAVVRGMAELSTAVRHLQCEHGHAWWPVFVRFYLGEKRTCDLCDSCAMQSMSPEVARSDEQAHAAFEAGLLDVADAIVSGPDSPGAPRDVNAALAAMASLIGAVTLARAVASPHLAERIASTVASALRMNDDQ